MYYLQQELQSASWMRDTPHSCIEPVHFCPPCQCAGTYLHETSTSLQIYDPSLSLSIFPKSCTYFRIYETHKETIKELFTKMCCLILLLSLIISCVRFIVLGAFGQKLFSNTYLFSLGFHSNYNEIRLFININAELYWNETTAATHFHTCTVQHEKCVWELGFY